MTQARSFDDIVGHLVATAKAHHAATGGVNPQWAKWYAEHLVDDLNEALGSNMEVGELESWLIEADRRYRNTLREAVESGRLDEAEDDARRLDDAEERESREAEESAAKRSKEEDPNVRRDYDRGSDR